ncbi:UNVERIFIED_CONTAM: copper amine oxidase-like protein [Acetivibrio alkalicellulosi]
MKKLSVLVLLSIVCMLFCSAFLFTNNVSANTDITVIINGKIMEFGTDANDPQPYIKDGRTLVPFRRIFEELKMDVTWDGNTRTVYARNETTIMELGIGRNVAFVNGERRTLDVPPEITDNRTFVPLRFVSESIGADVGWDGVTRTVTITLSREVLKLGQQGTYKDRVFTVDSISDKDESNRIVITGTTNSNARGMLLEVHSNSPTPFTILPLITELPDGGYYFRASIDTLRSKPKFVLVKMLNENDNYITVARYEIN